MKKKSEKPRGLRLVDSIVEQLKTKPVETIEEAHAEYVAVLNNLDYDYLMHLIWSSGKRHKKGSQKKLQIRGFDVWKTPAIPFGKPKLLTREDAAAVVSEFTEKLHNLN